MTDFVPYGEIGELLRQAREIYSQAGELCRMAEIGGSAGGEALRRVSELVEIGNDLTQKAFGLMGAGREE